MKTTKMLYLDMRVIMKKRTLTALILSALAAGQLISLSARMRQQQRLGRH
jgi:hypothetical protein